MERRAKILVLVADDHKATRLLIRTLLSQRPDWEICAEASDGREAVELAKNSCPDLAILDVQMPNLNGIDAAKELLTHCPSTIILSDSSHDANILIEVLKKIGVKGFVNKSKLATELLPAIEAVLNGEIRFVA